QGETRAAASLFLHEEGELAIGLVVREQLVAGLAREGLEVLHRARVGGKHLQHLARLQIGQRLFRAQDGKRAVQPAGIEFLVEIHGNRPRASQYKMLRTMGYWLLMVAQLPAEDPAARMRVLRTLESLGAGVLREGAYALPDSPANRRA